MKTYNIEVLRICKTTWNPSQLSKLSTQQSIIYSHIVTQTTTTNTLTHSLTCRVDGYHDVPLNTIQPSPLPRTANQSTHTTSRSSQQHPFNSKQSKLTIIQCYTTLHYTTPHYTEVRCAPTNNQAHQHNREEFYRQLKSLLHNTAFQLQHQNSNRWGGVT
ncbi:unnamed protein product [Heterobilharzia americana]|nr:unnamed protein product [Heterobilharzia americana]